MLTRLRQHGFQVAESSESHRGSSVMLTNGAAATIVTADWLEGEIEIAVGPIGEESIDVHSFVPADVAHGLRLRRLPRDVSTAVVEDQLAQAADLLLQHQSALLTRT